MEQSQRAVRAGRLPVVIGESCSPAQVITTTRSEVEEG